jgi:galactonate dehydratase
VNRRSILKGFGAAGALGAGALTPLGGAAVIGPNDSIKITKLETFYVKPRWLFLKVHTDAGIVGIGEPTLEGRSRSVATAVSELGRYLVGKDPRQVLTHWNAMYRFPGPYRGGPILSSALSGVDQALWDISGKAWGVPVWKLMGGPTRDRVKLYWDTLNDPPARLQEKIQEGFTAFKAAPMEYSGGTRPSPMPPRDTPGYLQAVVDNYRALREAIGPNRDFACHIGQGSYRHCMQVIRAVEPLSPMFFEIHGNNYEYDMMARIASQTSVPIATGEDVYTKWGFRPILLKAAATILQPDCSHAGGITEVVRIAAMADAFDVEIAPHNPLSPINLAAGLHVAAVIPNFHSLETSDRGIGHPKMQGWPESWRGVEILKEPFKVVDGHLPIPTKPGLGIELDENALEKHRTDVPADER